MIGHPGSYSAQDLERSPESRRRPLRAAAAPTDEELMAAYVAGSDAAFSELFLRYGPILGRMLRRYSGDDAPDLVQQTFLQVHRRRATFSPDQAFRPWVVTIARNLARDVARKRARRYMHVDTSDVAPSSRGSSPERSTEARRFVEALAALPTAEREIIALSCGLGMTLAEAGAEVGTNVNTAKARARRGYSRLRAAL